MILSVFKYNNLTTNQYEFDEQLEAFYVRLRVSKSPKTTKEIPKKSLLNNINQATFCNTDKLQCFIATSVKSAEHSPPDGKAYARLWATRR